MGDTTKAAEEPVRLGLMPPLSGLVEMYGPEISRAGQIACQEINDNGGVLGRPLELIIEDDGSLPESAVAAANILVREKHCDAIIGNLLSNSRIAVAYRVAEPLKVPYLNFSFYEGSIHSHYFFHFAALPNQQIDKMIPYMKEKYGSKMFFAGNNYEWPRGSIDAAKRSLLACDGEIVGEEYTTIGVSIDEIDELLDRVMQASPDVFVPYFAGEDQVNLLTRFTEKGLKDRMAVVMGHYDEMMASHLPAEVREGFYSNNTYFMSIDTAENRGFLQRLSAYPEVSGIWPNGNGILTNFGEGTYLCVKAFAEAANKAGSLDSEALIQSLESVRLKSPQGEVSMDPVSHHAVVNTYLSRCEADGGFRIVEAFGADAPVIPERYSHQRITHQATMEEDIRLQARMLEQMSEGVFLFDTSDTSAVYVNEGGLRLFGCERNEMIGMSLSRLIAACEEAPAGIVEQITSRLRHSGQWQGEVKNVKKDATPFWIRITISTFTHPLYGEVWMAVVQDITRLKEMQMDLQHSYERLSKEVEERELAEIRLQQLADNINEVFWLGSVDWNEVYYVNPAYEKIWGQKAEDLYRNARMWLESVHPDDRQQVIDDIPEDMNSIGKCVEFREYRVQKPDGEVAWIKARAYPIKDEDGNVVRIAGVAEDISEHIKMQDIVQRSQKMDALGKLTGGIAHDFNNMLGVILGYTELLEHKLADTPALSPYIKNISTAGNRAKALTSKLLAFSRKQPSDKKVSNLNTLLEGERNMLEKTLTPKINLTIEKGDNLWDVCVDEEALADSILNLSINSMHAMPEGGALIIGARNVLLDGADTQLLSLPPGEYVRLSIEDTGAGMSKEIREKIFEPFFTTKGDGGTGLGMSQVYGFVKQSDGEIQVFSEPGEGTQIVMHLPRYIKQDVDECCIAESDEAVAPGASKNENILVVDDEPALRELAAEILESYDYQVSCAESGEEALRILAETDVDLVLTDVIMPKMDGYELASKVRQSYPEVKIIIASGYNEKAEAEEGEGAIFEKLDKPYNADDLLSKIRDSLDG